MFFIAVIIAAAAVAAGFLSAAIEDKKANHQSIDRYYREIHLTHYPDGRVRREVREY